MNATLPEDKFLNEFSLVPGGNKALKDYLDAHYAALCEEYAANIRNGPVLQGLAKILESVLPKEAKEELHHVLVNRSDRVVIIHDLPEREGLENHPTLKGWDAPKSYSFFLGNALYSLNNAHHATAYLLTRDKDQEVFDSASWVDGGHRDLFGEHVIYSSPYNGECACTQFTRMKKAMESIPKEAREKIMVNVITGRDQWRQRDGTILTLEEALQQFNNPGNAKERKDWIRIITLASDPAKVPEAALYRPAIEKYSKLIEVKPNMLVVICEDGVSHAPRMGDSAKIAMIPDTQRYTRLFIHNAGRTDEPSR